MSTNEKKVIKHRILDKHPIVGIILLTVLALFMIQGFIGGVLGVGIALVLGLPQEPILYISMVVSAFRVEFYSKGLVVHPVHRFSLHMEGL